MSQLSRHQILGLVLRILLVLSFIWQCFFLFPQFYYQYVPRNLRERFERMYGFSPYWEPTHLFLLALYPLPILTISYEHRALGGGISLAVYGLGGITLNSMRVAAMLRIFGINLTLNLLIALVAGAYLINVYGPRFGLFKSEGLDAEWDKRQAAFAALYAAFAAKQKSSNEGGGGNSGSAGDKRKSKKQTKKKQQVEEASEKETSASGSSQA